MELPSPECERPFRLATLNSFANFATFCSYSEFEQKVAKIAKGQGKRPTKPRNFWCDTDWQKIQIGSHDVICKIVRMNSTLALKDPTRPWRTVIVYTLMLLGTVVGFLVVRHYGEALQTTAVMSPAATT